LLNASHGRHLLEGQLIAMAARSIA